MKYRRRNFGGACEPNRDVYKRQGFFPVISDFMLSVTEGVLSLLSIISVSPENRTVLPLSLSDCNKMCIRDRWISVRTTYLRR